MSDISNDRNHQYQESMSENIDFRSHRCQKKHSEPDARKHQFKISPIQGTIDKRNPQLKKSSIKDTIDL